MALAARILEVHAAWRIDALVASPLPEGTSERMLQLVSIGRRVLGRIRHAVDVVDARLVRGA